MDIGHDLTEKGVESAHRTGALLKEDGRISEDDEMYLLHSPKPRAKGTLDFVAQGAGVATTTSRSTKQLRASDVPNKEVFMARINELGANQEAVAKDHYTNPQYEENPGFIEPNSKKKERLYRAFEYLIRTFDKQEPNAIKTPHVLAVSHFEIITHLIDDVFGIETFDGYNTPSFGETISIEAAKTDSPHEVVLQVNFRDRSKEVVFNRKTRSIEVSEKNSFESNR